MKISSWIGEELGGDVVFCPRQRRVFGAVVAVVGAPDGNHDCAVGVEPGVDQCGVGGEGRGGAIESTKTTKGF